MSSAGENSSNFPTMIIPKGTEIRLNEEGQLSIKTPGNLVIQNSGNYSEIESTNGSIRIEENVKVDAVSVRAGQACFIQGTLTAWRVHAKKIALEDRARAYIMLQESESLDLSPTSRLVGNFANEKEVYLLLGKFSRQLRQLPGAVGMAALEDDEVAPESGEKAIDALTGPGRAAEDVTRGMSEEEPESMPRKSEREPAPQKPPSATTDMPLAVRQAVSLIEIELNRSDINPGSREAFRELLYALRNRELKRAEIIYRDAFSEVAIPSDNLKRAYDLLDRHFEGRG